MSGDSSAPDDSARSWLANEGFDLAALALRPPSEGFIPDLDSYDHVLVAYSGGKDSQACVLHLLELGVPRHKIECQHHLVDGREGSTLMDWPVTEAYCTAACQALGVTLTFSWREAGIEREALREQSPTAPVWIPIDGAWQTLGGKGPLGTRRKFPQVSADLSLRWCSASAKISSLDAYLRKHPRFIGTRTLVVTGVGAAIRRLREQRRPELTRCSTKQSKRKRRTERSAFSRCSRCVPVGAAPSGTAAEAATAPGTNTPCGGSTPGERHPLRMRCCPAVGRTTAHRPARRRRVRAGQAPWGRSGGWHAWDSPNRNRAHRPVCALNTRKRTQDDATRPDRRVRGMPGRQRGDVESPSDGRPRAGDSAACSGASAVAKRRRAGDQVVGGRGRPRMTQASPKASTIAPHRARERLIKHAFTAR
jgi:3'-phosphoadenosine 5'-phosphosulfate sulfotransferase (PAPS reductase)/FAD synthetase